MTILREIRDTGRTLRAVWDEYKRRSFGKKLVDKKLGEAYTDFIAEKERAKLSKCTLKAFKSNGGWMTSPPASCTTTNALPCFAQPSNSIRACSATSPLACSPDCGPTARPWNSTRQTSPTAFMCAGKTAKDRQQRYVEIIPVLNRLLSNVPAEQKHGAELAQKMRARRHDSARFLASSL